MATYRFKPTTFAVNPTADSGTSILNTGAAFSDATKLGAFAGVSDSVPSSFPVGFPPANDVVAYQNAIAYYDATDASQRCDRIRATNFTEVGTGTAIATKLAGHTNIQITRKLGFLDGDVYAGFPSGGGGLFHLHGVRMEARNGSGAIAGTYQQFSSIFEDGGQPSLVHLTTSPWSITEAQLSTAFGINFYVYCSEVGVDSFELTPNLGVFAVELVVTADPPAAAATARRRARGRWAAGRVFCGV